MDLESLIKLQGYGYFSLVTLMVVILYSYIYHLYRSESKGRRNYEKYSTLALDDAIDDKPLESMADAKTQMEEQK